MASYILDKAYSIDESAGVGAYRALVHGDTVGTAKLPGAANAGAILGVTVHSQSRQGGHVAIRKAGIARVMAAGAIALGAPVNIADTEGRVKEVDEEAGTHVECLGFAETSASAEGDIVEVFIAPHERIVPTP